MRRRSRSPSVSISLAVGDNTHAAPLTRSRALSTSEAANVNGVTSAAPRHAVMTSASVWNAMFDASEPTSAQPPYEAIARNVSGRTRDHDRLTPGSSRHASTHVVR